MDRIYQNSSIKNEESKLHMRVIAGKAKRLALKTIEGMDTRPTTDRIKETLFNILQQDLYDCYFSDLFSGSGAIGIEALSRGAKEAYFVENNKKAVNCIKENLVFTKLKENAIVMEVDVLTALKRLEDRKIVFSIIFLDPPYHKMLEKEVLKYLQNSSLIDNHTLIIVEAALDTEISYLQEYGYYLEKKKQYKTNQHYFIRKK